MEEQRQRARIGAATAHGSEDRHEKVLAFAAAAPPTRFVGYETLRATTGLAAVQARRRPRPGQARGEPLLRRGRRPGRRLRACCAGTGGRRGCVDVYRVGEDQALEVEPARRPRPDAAVEAEVDRETRHATMRNHTATHLLHAALRERLGTHVRQAGSAVRPDKLRFDFTHGQPLGAEELREVEDRVNEWIKAEPRRCAGWRWSATEAEKLGAMALFGEKYGEWVRVVEVDGVSRELCGGTHVANTAEVGIFKIVSEGSSAANVRRIEALTGPGRDRLVPRARGRAARGGELLGAPAGPARRRPPRGGAAARGRRGRRAGARRQMLGEEAERLAERGRARSAASKRGRRRGRRARRPEAAARRSPTGSSRSSAAARRSSSAAARASKVGLVVLVSKDAVERGLSAAAIVARGGAGRRRRRRRPRRHGAGRRQGPGEARRGAGGGARAAIERELG